MFVYLLPYCPLHVLSLYFIIICTEKPQQSNIKILSVSQLTEPITITNSNQLTYSPKLIQSNNPPPTTTINQPSAIIEQLATTISQPTFTIEQPTVNINQPTAIINQPSATISHHQSTNNYHHSTNSHQ